MFEKKKEENISIFGHIMLISDRLDAPRSRANEEGYPQVPPFWPNAPPTLTPLFQL